MIYSIDDDVALIIIKNKYINEEYFILNIILI